MGYGPIKNGKHTPITPWKGSWAAEQEERRRAQKDAPPGCQICGKKSDTECGRLTCGNRTKQTVGIPDGLSVSGRVWTGVNTK